MKQETCIDAGHYGKYNQSPADKTYFESERMWDLHLLQKEYLEQRGIKVKTTREDQKKDLDLKKRGLAAEGCAVFISNHTNSTAAGTVNEEVDRVVVYHLYDDDTTNIDELSKELAHRLAPAIAKLMGTKQGYEVLSRKSSNDRNGDGIFNDNYYGVLNGARIAGTPGVIVEHGFHTNPRCVAWLKSSENLDKLARLEADIIADFLNEKFGKEEEKPVEYYRVQVGAYLFKSNAERKKKKIVADGFSAIIKKVGLLYKVQVGAYVVEANAESLKKKLKAKGHSAFITKGP